MSNNGNILSGLFRSISRRGQRRAEESDSPSHADVNMEPQSSPTSTLVDQPTPNTAVINSVNADDGIQSDSSMPPLQAVSDSDGDDSGSEDEGEDIQRGNFMDTADSFHSGDIILHPDEDEDMPPLPIRPSPFANMRSQGTRRARVEDDGDGDSERDRRHPSQRALHNQSEPDPIRPLHPPQTNEHVHRHIVFSNFAGGAPGVGAGAAGPLPPNPHHRAHPQHPFPVHLMAQMGFDAHSNTTQNGNPEFSNNGSQGNNTNTPVGAPPQDHQNQQPHGAMPHTPNSFAAILQSLFQAAGSQPGAAFTTALNGVPIGDNEPHAGATNGGNSGFLGNLFTAMEGGAFTFNTNIPGGLPFFGFRPAQERENPERAKHLVNGLEEVPVGLIRRLERVSPEGSGCAICWEKLLEQDAEYLRMEEEEQKETKDASKADKNKTTDASASFVQNTEATNSFTSISTSPPSPSSSASKRASPANEVPKYPRIVTLPCSHVFHAECLIPWFTRPRQTTCPTCRFNIDPDDLTRGIGTRRRAAAPAAAGGRGGSDVALSEDTIPPFTVMDEIGTINPVTGPPIPLDGVPFVGSVNGGGDGNSTFVPFQPGIISAGNPGVIGSGFFTHFPSGAAHTLRTASTQNVNNSGGSPSAVNPTTPTVDRLESGTHAGTNSSNANAPVTTPTATAADIDPATLIPPGAPRLPTRQPWFSQNQVPSQVFESVFGRMFPYAGGHPGQNPGAPANAPSVPSPNNTSRAPVPPHPAPHMHHIPPQGNMHHHHLHHAGDSYVTIGFDFVIGPEAPPLGPRDANPPQADATSNTTQDRPSTPSVDDRINTFSAGNLHVTPESVPHQAEARGLPSVNNSGAEQGMLGGVEFHAIGVDIGIDDSDLDPSAFSDEDEFIEFARMMNVRPPTDSQTPNNNPNPDVPVTQPHSQFDSRATPNVAANNQQPGASSNTPPNHNAQPNSNVSPRLPDLSGYFNSMFSAAIPGTAGPRRPQNFARGGPRAHSAARGSSRPQERRTWVPPPPPGPTLRQTIERREREAGLRCWDVSCGLAPDDDCPLREIPEELKRQVRIRQETAASASSSQEGSGDSKGKGKEKAEKDPEPQYVCEHSFHTPCLVTAQRVALNGADEVVLEEGKSVEVSCPICRASGMMPRDDWEDGVRSLESDLD